MTTRRSLLLALPAAASLHAAPAFAQSSYPDRPIRFIVTTSAGAGTDIVARHVSAALGKVWNTPTVVDNRPGAGGVIGTDAVAKAPADGYTLLVTFSNHYTNQWVEKTPYDAVADFEPLARLAVSAPMMLTAADAPYRTVADVIAAARRAPNTIAYGSAGDGTTTHMCGALLNQLAGIRMVHTPYKNFTQVLVDTASGQVQVSFSGAVALPLIKAGKLRVLAVTRARRTANMPEVPTMNEAAGIDGYDIVSPIWVFAPRGTPPAVVNKLSEALVAIASGAEFKAFLAAQNLDLDVQNAAAAKAAAPAELAKWRQLVALTRT